MQRRMPPRARRRRTTLRLAALVAVALALAGLPAATGARSARAAADPVTVPLAGHLNNDGIDTAGARDGNFDGAGYAYPAEELPAAGTATLGGIPYAFPSGGADADNVVALGQTVTVPEGRYQGASLLAASSYGPAGGTATVHYTDGTTSTATVSAPDWYNGPAGVAAAAYRYAPGGADQHPVRLYALGIAADPARTMTSVTLPTTAAAAANAPSLHVFALTLTPPAGPVTVDLTGAFGNDGIDTAGARDGDLDGAGSAYPAEALPAAGTVTLDGTPFAFPSSAPGAKNNVVATGQTIDLPQGRYGSVHALVASTYGETGGTATVHYTDGTSGTATLTAPDWYGGGGGALNPAYRYTAGGVTEQHAVHLYTRSLTLDPDRTVASITLPATNAPAPNKASLHVFALTLQPVVAGTAVRVTSARSTTRQLPGGGGQVVEATVENVGSDWITPATSVNVTVSAEHATTTTPAVISALGPGEQARVRIGVAKDAATPAGTTVSGQVVATTATGQASSAAVDLKLGVAAYTADDASLNQHESPVWFDDAKFGIFIHWGPYSVPAWAPVGREYAEWYWKHMNEVGSPTYEHHRDTYGTNFDYDDFIPQFTAQNFDPNAWIDLFGEAGAKYFVLTSKHHDGFSLFDTAVSGRDSVELGPHQDLVKKLFDAARTRAPDLKRGLYYSMPEWYNPSYPAGDSTFQRGPATNPYTGATVPYTGYTPVNDYVQDFQKPQMLELADQYQPDVLWCDIGGPNDSRPVLAHWFNAAAARGQEVTVDNRCGIGPHDFTTPEYATYDHVVTDKWEASRGIDPFSYGYNAATPDSAYESTNSLIDSLVDITSKNGNFLLDIGPRADGTIPEIMQSRLRELGAWLRVNGESIYGTTYWSRTPESGNLRFTVKQNDAFYVTALDRPGDQVTIDAPVPIADGDQVTLLGWDGGPLHWSEQGGKLVIDVPAAAQQSGNNAWVFKIKW